MRKILFLLMIVAFFVGPALAALTYNQAYYKKNMRQSLSASRKDPLYNLIGELDSLSIIGTGSVFYVDSGVASGSNSSGTTWSNAVTTLDAGVALCTANRGDVIRVAQGHAETWTAVDSADLDIAGITVEGLGTGSDRPTFTYTGTTSPGELVIAAANVTIRNLVFSPGVANVVHAIEIEADADGSIIEFCEFTSGSTDAFEFVDAIQVTAAADDLIIRYNKATETTAGAVSWLDLSAGVVDNLSMYGNEIYGDYSTGAVDSTGRIQTVGYYGYNVITNLSTGDAAFYFNAAATGVMEFNSVFTDAVATAIDPGSMSCAENYVSITTDLAAVLIPPVPAIATVTAGSADDILKKMYYVADGAGAYPTTVANDSTIAKIMCTGATATANTYNNTTDSLEAISNALSAGTGSATALSAIFLDNLAATSVADEIVNNSFFADLTTTGSDWSDFDASTDSMQAISDKITALTGYYFTGTNTAASTTTPVVALLAGYGDGYFVTDWVMICTYDVGGAAGAPEGEVRDITAYTSSTGTFTVSAFGTALANGDKVMVMRREMVAMLNFAAGTGNYPTGVLDDSVMAYILSDDATAAASSYNNTTDSLEAISNSLSTNTLYVTGTDTTAAADADLTTYVVDGSILSHIMTAGADTSDYAASTDSLEAISVALAAGTGATVAIDADQLDHVAGTDTTVAADGDLTTYIADGTILSHTMTKGADTSDYQASTDSLEAIADQIEYAMTITRTGGGALDLVNGTNNLFVVSGPVEVMAIGGIVTNDLKVVANACKFIHTTTVPASAVDLTSAVECSGDVAGTSYTINTTIGGALIPTTAGTVATSTTVKFLAPAGTIGFNAAGTFDAADAIQFFIKYKPLVSGARVTASP